MESEQGDTNRNGVPIPAPGIGTRIAEVASAVGTRKIAAAAARISADTLQRYIREETEPSFGPLALLTREAGYSLDWLATGAGPKHPAAGVGEGAAPYAARLDRLRQAHDALADVVRDERPPVSDAVLGDLQGLAFTYRLDEPAVRRIVQLLFAAFKEGLTARESGRH